MADDAENCLLWITKEVVMIVVVQRRMKLWLLHGGREAASAGPVIRVSNGDE